MTSAELGRLPLIAHAPSRTHVEEHLRLQGIDARFVLEAETGTAVQGSSPPGSAPRSCRGSQPTSGAPRHRWSSSPTALVAQEHRGSLEPPPAVPSRRRGVRGCGALGMRRGAPARAARGLRPRASFRSRASTSSINHRGSAASQRPKPPRGTKGHNGAPLLRPSLALGRRALHRRHPRHVHDLLRHPGRSGPAGVRPARDAPVHRPRAALSGPRPAAPRAVRPVPRPARRAPVARALVHDASGRDAGGAPGGARHRVARVRRRSALAAARDPDRDHVGAAPEVAARPSHDGRCPDRHLRAPRVDRLSPRTSSASSYS